MTRNQIEYWNMKETGRHNIVTEKETGRHNVATEKETNRHNLVQENIDLGHLNESIRHNKATETETNRHNLRTEGQTDVSLGLEAGKLHVEEGKLQETIRHNQASETLSNRDLNIKSEALGETERHNYMTETIDYSRVSAQNALDELRAQAQQVENEWASVQKTQQYTLTEAQKKQINQQISESNARIADLENQMNNRNYNTVINGVNAVGGLVRSAASMVDALIPG